MVVSQKRIVSDDFLTKFDVLDTDLVPSREFIRNFGDPSDYVESHIYTYNNQLVYSDQNYVGFKYPSVINNNTEKSTVNSLIFDPATHLQDLGFIQGIYRISYNIFRKRIYNSPTKPFFIKEISNDRTEIRLASNEISNLDIESGVLNFISEIQAVPYYKDFLLNFGDNNIVNAVNIALDKNTKNYTILVKLYKPLDSQFKEKDSLWIVEELSESYTYEIELEADTITPLIPYLRSANFDVEYKKDTLISSDYFSINSLFSNDSLTAYQKILNEISNKQVRINIDYSDFSNFVHFSSAKERILNFQYKLSLIESYQTDLNLLTTVPNYTSSLSVSSSVVSLQNNINKIIEKFDGYENYLYYTSGSTAWPKSNTTQPYILYSTTSSQGLAWVGSDNYLDPYYGGIISSASIYDLDNPSNLNFSSPEFLNEDDRNVQYQLFLNMVGQHFDNIWLYIKAISDVYDSRNAIDKGVSRDLVYHVLKGLGVKLYNSSANDNIFDYLLGISPSGSYLPVSQSNQTLITASSYNVSGYDYNTEIYKRIYHNINYLSKTKGTARGLKALVTTYGIPSTILDVVNYGGSDKTSRTIEYSYDRFTYALNNENTSYIRLYWAPLTVNAIKYGIFDRVADGVELRFKPSTATIKSQQVLLAKAQVSGSSLPNLKFAVVMDYTASNGVDSANVKFIMSGSNGYASSSITAPIFALNSQGDTSWWNLAITRENSRGSNQDNLPQTYYLYLKNKIGDNIGHEYSASLYFSGSAQESYNHAWVDFGTTASFNYLYIGGTNFTSSEFGSNNSFLGQLQEIRLWGEPISESAFNNHVLNPESYQGAYTSSAYYGLAARFPLGNNLLTYNHYLTSSLIPVQPNYSLAYSSGNFDDGNLYGLGLYGYGIYGDSGSLPLFTLTVNSASFYNYSNINNYSNFTETYYAVSPNSGYYNPVTEKVRISYETGSSLVLSPDLSFENKPYRTNDVHFTDISFSPQNEIDKDIIAHFGDSLNLDNFIGDTRFEYSSSYENLDDLKDQYYRKYVSKYDYRDFVNLISYFDGSLFKMIKDFVPARTNVSTGITIKSPILERNRVKRNPPIFQDNYNYYTGSIISASIFADTEHNSGVGDGRDFYTGELSSSMLDVNEQFEEKNFNPYLHPTSSIDLISFEKSEFNVLYSNVSSSRISQRLKTLDYVVPQTISYSAQVQDYYYDYKRHSYPRYEGSRLISSNYNVYTPGDISYNKEPNIEYNVRQFAWINRIPNQSVNFYDKTTLSIKYLIDSGSNITQLSRQNKNLFEIQNTFRSSDTATVILFDPYNPSLQTGLSNIKPIWRGGFSYNPIIYRENDVQLTFKYTVPILQFSSNIGFKAVSKDYSTWNRSVGQQAFDATPGGYVTITKNGAPSATPYAKSHGTRYDWKYPSQISLAFSGEVRTFGAPTKQYTSLNSNQNWYGLDYYGPISTAIGDGGYANGSMSGVITDTSDVTGRYVVFTAPGDATYIVNSSLPFILNFTSIYTDPRREYNYGNFDFKVVGILEVQRQSGGDWAYLGKTSLQILSYDNLQYISFNLDESFISALGGLGVNNFRGAAVLRDFKVSLKYNDKLRIRYYFIDTNNCFDRTNTFTFSLEAGSAALGNLEVISQTLSSYTRISDFVITEERNGSISSFMSKSATDDTTVVFSKSASIMYGTGYFTTQSATLTDRYSNIIDAFTIREGDLVRFGSFYDPNPSYYTVRSVRTPIVFTNQSGTIFVSQSLAMTLDRQVNNDDVNSNYFAILRQYPDETSVILNYTKPDGETSKGVLIPFNLVKEINNNVANIIQPIKQTLLLDT